MKNKLLFFFFVSFSSIILGQVYELGVSLGGTNYVGDIGRTNYIYPNKVAGAVFFKYNMNPRVALRATYSYLPIQGNDKNAETNFKKNRGLSFTNTVNELALGVEFNFYEYDLSTPGKTWTPYVLVELAAFNYKNVASEPSPYVYNYANKISFSVPVSVGYKSKLIGALAFAVEAKFSYTFEDDLDYSTGRFPSLNFGGKGNDWYMFTGVSLIYTFGRPACYTNGL